MIGGERERRSNAPGSLIVPIRFAPTDAEDINSLVTLCKGIGTGFLETFRRYLPIAHIGVV